MVTVAYAYSHPFLDSSPEPITWQDLEGELITRVYHDLGDRLQLQQLLEDCAAPNDGNDNSITDDSITKVVLQRLDDLGDTVDEVGDRLQQFQKLGVTVRSLDPDTEFPAHSKQTVQTTAIEPKPDPSSLLTLFQTLQQRQNSQRLRLGHARNRVKALPPPGKAPYGYRRGKERYAIDRSTAPVVKDFVEHFLLYGSLRGSVRYLAKKYNKTISVSTGQRWLSSPVYRGDLAYRNGDVVPDTHSPIISRDEAAQVDRLLRRNRKLPARTASAPRSLAGLVTCGTCQSAMKITRTTSRKKGSKAYLYLTPVACPYRITSVSALQSTRPEDTSPSPSSPSEEPLPRTPCRSIPYDQVFNATIETICTELPQAIAKATLPDLDGLKAMIQQQIAAKEAILQQLPQLQEAGILDADTAELRAYTVRTEIADLRQRRDQLPPVNLMAIAQTVSIPQFWLDLSEAERRFYFREFIERIEITPVQLPSVSNSSAAQPLSFQPLTLRLVFMF
ncbi:MAG: recombinase family protein [Leptolyngbyaceae bacterium]|nr:recombinase family protein [Leptolyngbyaceae bacterium]